MAGSLRKHTWSTTGRSGQPKPFLDDATIPALYEAAFTFQRIRTRADILKRNGQHEFDLVEVKSTTGTKDEHIPDVAIQMYVVEGSGVPIRRAYLMHLNSAYVYQGGDYDLEQLFTLEDVSGEARLFVAENVTDDLARMWAALQLDNAPDIETGRHCEKPYRCSFFGHCHRNGPEHPVRELPGLRQKEWEQLKASGICDIGSIPSDFPGLASPQRRVRDSVVGGCSFISPELGPRLREVAFPASFLDFETAMPAIPVYVGTRPYQAIPFQWSLHVRDSSGQLRHDSFLNGDAEDPRERFAASLLEAVPSEGAIITYSSYEKTIMGQLAQAFPQYRDRLLALCDRVVDLLKLVRDNYYHPGFHGSYSLKSVLPVLVPTLGYADLEIQEGLAASASYARLIAGDTPNPRRRKLGRRCSPTAEGIRRRWSASTTLSWLKPTARVALLEDSGGQRRGLHTSGGVTLIPATETAIDVKEAVLTKSSASMPVMVRSNRSRTAC